MTGGDHADEDSLLEAQDAITAVSISLDDNTGTATLTVNTTNGDQTIAGTVNGAAAGEGILNINDDDSGESHLATFSGIIGGSGKVGTINIGSSTLGGDANFGAAATAGTVNLSLIHI